MNVDTTEQVLQQRKDALAKALLVFHPDLSCAVFSDGDRRRIVEEINTLISHHCLVLRMASTTGAQP